MLVGGKAEKPVRIPSLPASYQASVKRVWRDFWRSPVAQAVNREADLAPLLDWAWDRNELATVIPVLTKARLITGPVGQPGLNPLAAYVNQLRTRIARVEIEFGMTPLARSRLGLTIGQAKLTAQELNRRLERQGEAAPARIAESWESEWEEV